MALTSEQRSRLEAEAKRRGVDPAALVAEAEALSEESAASDESGKPAKPAKTDAPLYAYHLPFVTVNEVRTVWLGLGPVPGGEQYAGEWIVERSAGAKPDDDSAA